MDSTDLGPDPDARFWRNFASRSSTVDFLSVPRDEQCTWAPSVPRIARARVMLVRISPKPVMPSTKTGLRLQHRHRVSRCHWLLLARPPICMLTTIDGRLFHILPAIAPTAKFARDKRAFFHNTIRFYRFLRCYECMRLEISSQEVIIYAFAPQNIAFFFLIICFLFDNQLYKYLYVHLWSFSVTSTCKIISR